MENDEHIDTNNMQKKQKTLSKSRTRFVFRKPRTTHQSTSHGHASVVNNLNKKFVIKYLREIRDTPTQACAICEM